MGKIKLAKLAFSWQIGGMKEQLKALEEKSRELGELMKQIETSQASLADLGTLEMKKKGGVLTFYQYFGKDAPRKYLNKSQAQLIASLAQKRYYMQVYEAAREKKKAVDQCVAIMKSEAYVFNLASIYEALPAEFREKVKPIGDFDAEYARKWQERKFTRSQMRYEAVFKTKRGEYVRSKSELIIADRLYDAGIPYHYEVEFRNKQGKLLARPDFYVLNPRTRKEYLWEHFGMLDSAEYANDFISKMNLYAQYGYFPGEKLIATFESSKYPLTPEQIYLAIEKYLK